MVLTSWVRGYSQCGTIDFSPDVTKGCAPFVVKFTATGAPMGSAYVWDFGNGAVNGLDTIVKAFTTAGKYTVTLIVTPPGGAPCQIIKKDIIETLPTPQPDITLSPGRVLCAGPKEVTFTDNTQGVVSRKWIIDGKTYDNAPAVVKYTFTSKGFKNVTLQVTNSHGCVGLLSDNKYVQIFDSVETDFCADIVVTDTLVSATYRPSVLPGGRTITKYEWGFSGGSPSTYTGTTPPLVKYTPGKLPHDAWLKVTTSDGCTYTAYKKNFIQQFISIPKDSLCIGVEFALRNLAANNGRGFFEWNFPDAVVNPEGSSVSQQLVTYIAAGKQDFKYYFKYHKNGCKTSVSYPEYIKIMGPKVAFGADTKVTCDPNKRIVFRNMSQEHGATNVRYTWRFYDKDDKPIPGAVIGPISKLDTSMVFGKEGKFGVSLTGKSDNGCRDSMFLPGFININKPKADFELEDSTVCAGSTIQFISRPDPPEEKGTTYTYIWTIQHADSVPVFYTLSGKTPSLTPLIPGLYHVKLVIQTSASCSDTIYKKNYLTVNGVFSSFTVDDPDGCPNPYFNTVLRMSNRVVKYPKHPSNVIKNEWKVDPGDDVYIVNPFGTSTQVFFNSPGVYTVTLNFYDSENCTTQVVKKDFIYVGAKAGFEIKERKCLGDTHRVFNFSDLTIPKFKWFADPPLVTFTPSDSIRDPGIIFNKDTCYDLYCVGMKLIDGEYCTDTFKKHWCTNLPKADFSTDDTTQYCAPSVVEFTATGSAFADKFFWDFGDGSTLFTENPDPTHLYLQNNPKGFTVKLTAIDTNGCMDTIVKPNLVKITGPAPKFSVDKHTGCDSLKVTFINESVNVNKWALIYNDGSDPVSEDTTVHWYRLDDPTKDSIVFKPILILLEEDPDCDPYWEDTIIIYRSPRANFTADSMIGCMPLGVNFTDISYNSIEWAWDLDGDGIVDDSTQNPHFVYPKPGKYDVKLWTRNPGSCPDSTVKKAFIEVLPIPEANFSMSNDSFCNKEEISFMNHSKDYYYYMFDYGDGTAPDSNQIVPHMYYFDEKRDSGDSVVFTPSITVYSKAGCYDVYYDTIVAYANPITSFKPDVTTGCTPLAVQFDDTSKHAVAWEWDFDNNGTVDSRDKEPLHYFGPGFHTVKLKTYSIAGCTDSLVKVNLIEVNPIPEADFAVSDSVICINESVNFTDISTPQTNIVKWLWIFDDAVAGQDSSYDQNPKFTFRSTGYHNIMLAVEDNRGCRDTIFKKAVYVEDTLAPANSTLLYVSVIDSGVIEAVWNRNTVYDFEEYTLTRSGGITKKVFSSTDSEDTTFTDTDPQLLTSFKYYCYTVHTRDACNNVSGESEKHCTMLLEGEGINSGKANITWTAYTGWTPDRYIIWRASANLQFKKLDSLPGGGQTVYSDSGLCDETYTYYIEAIHPSKPYRSLSNRVKIRPPYEQQDSPLELYVATVDNNKAVKIFWQDSRQKNLSLYMIDRYTPEKGWQKNYHLTKNTEFVDTRVDVSKSTYTYRVRVQDDCGYTSAYSNTATSILLNHKIVNDHVELRWNHYRYWAPGVSKYQVQIQERNKTFRTIATLPGTDSTFTDDSLYSSIDTAYCYRIIAFEDGLNGDTSISNTTCTILPSRIFVPTAFTPGDADTLNATWKVSTLSLYNNTGEDLKDFNVKIFNRWGQLIFEANDINAEWDGTMNGGQAPADVYIYTINAEGIDGRTYHLKGNITLLR